MTFQKRALTSPVTLGQRLQQLREDRRLSIDEVARAIQVAPKYLRAIEEGHYQILPGKVYARNFVRRYVEHMELDSAAAMKRFDQEFQLTSSARPSRRPLMVERAKTDAPWLRRHFRSLIALVAVVGVLSYFAWQLFQLFSPPELVVLAPDRDISTTERMLVVRGKTNPGASVTINRQEVEVASDGSFIESVDLQLGLNTLHISASTPRSGERIVTRQVLVEAP